MGRNTNLKQVSSFSYSQLGSSFSRLGAELILSRSVIALKFAECTQRHRVIGRKRTNETAPQKRHHARGTFACGITGRRKQVCIGKVRTRDSKHRYRAPKPTNYICLRTAISHKGPHHLHLEEQSIPGLYWGRSVFRMAPLSRISCDGDDLAAPANRQTFRIKRPHSLFLDLTAPHDAGNDSSQRFPS